MGVASDHFQRVSELFEAARELPPDKRSIFLHAACADAPELLDEVMGLLSHHEDDFGVLSAPIVEQSSFGQIAVAAPDSCERIPVRIGSYVIQQRIGAGGMGAVYLAEQESPKRRVAVKVIRPGYLSSELLKRFGLEAAILGRLQHVGIAQIYEAGMFDDGLGGQPFFAMEFIEGPPLAEFVARHQLDTKQRLDLIARVCDAVHHAHLRGVIHRDLKPGNILVDVSGQPKVLDFGIARATDSDLKVTTMQTDAAQLIGTIPYMSPEQFIGRRHEIDFRCDVYALGVILYELLAGRLPHNLDDASLISAAKVITEDDPAPLSTINRAYRGDLNTIVLKALQKEPDRRYASAADLAADVRRYLADEPIAARPTTTMYQLRKFARRNRGLVGGLIAAFVILVAGIVATTVFALGQTRALKESERQRGIAEAVNSFLNDDLLAKANPYTGEAHDVKLRDVLDTAGEQISERFLDAPLVHAAIRATLGKTYFQLGLFDDAARHVERALTIYETEPLMDPDTPHELRNLLVLIYLQDDRLADAAGLIDTQMELLQRDFGDDHYVFGRVHENRGILLRKQGRLEEAVASYRAALEAYEPWPDVDKRIVLTTRQNLSYSLARLGQFEEAERLLQEVLDAKRELYGQRSADVAFVLTNLGDLYWRQERYAEAREVFELAYDIRLERLGETHLDTARTLYGIGLIEKVEGDFKKAEQTQRRVLALREKKLAPTHFDYMASLRAVGNTLLPQGRADEAVPFFHHAWRLAVKAYGPEHPTSRQWRNGAITAIKEAGQDERVRQVYQEYFAASAEWAATDKVTGEHLNMYAWDLLTCEREDLRDPVLALQIAERAVAMDGEQDPNILDTLAHALADNGRMDEAVATMRKALALAHDDRYARMRNRLEQSLDEFLTR